MNGQKEIGQDKENNREIRYNTVREKWEINRERERPENKS